MQLISPLVGGPQHPVTHEVKREKIVYVRMVRSQLCKTFLAGNSNQEKKTIFRLRYKCTCFMHLVVITDNTFCILSCTVCGNITGMEAAETL
jgi:hypothetical protein